MDDLIKFLLFVAAVSATCHSARTAWRLGTELLG